jgi:hypothetical protein
VAGGPARAVRPPTRRFGGFTTSGVAGDSVERPLAVVHRMESYPSDSFGLGCYRRTVYATVLP